LSQDTKQASVEHRKYPAVFQH